jgi:hypothetical protein
MTRRAFLTMASAPAVLSASGDPLVVPVHHIIDSRANFKPDQLQRFSTDVWQEAVRDFSRCGIAFKTSVQGGEIRRSPSDRPIFTGLEPGVVNMVLTGSIPLAWDNGRRLSGVATRWYGYHLCVIAVRYAHAHQIPFLSVNTCVHELMHVLLQDVYESHPQGAGRSVREWRIDLYATRLWLFRECPGLRDAASAYVGRLMAA